MMRLAPSKADSSCSARKACTIACAAIEVSASNGTCGSLASLGGSATP